MATRFIVLTVAALVCANAQDVSSIQQRLEAQYALTKTTFDQSDIVTQGSVLTLKIDKIVMVPVNGQDIFQNRYQNGRITQNAVDKGKHIYEGACSLISLFKPCPTSTSSVALPKTHTFVTGEKLWVTGIHVNDSAVVFDLFSDPYDNVRYKAALTIPTSLTQSEQTIAQIFAVESMASEVPPPTTTASENSLVPPSVPARNTDGVKVPAPPVAEPKIVVGQTTDQVVKILGQPQRRSTEPPNKTIYFYPSLSLKLTFVDDKLADFQ